MKVIVDLNADLGEGAGHDDELLALVTSANIACGFHAGDADTMKRSIEAARNRNVAVGAHPSLFDRENFGRKELSVKPDEVFEAVSYQLGIFQAIAAALGLQPNHVKPHGALYNMATRDQKLADAIARATKSVDSKLILFAPDDTDLARAGAPARWHPADPLPRPEAFVRVAPDRAGRAPEVHLRAARARKRADHLGSLRPPDAAVV